VTDIALICISTKEPCLPVFFKRQTLPVFRNVTFVLNPLGAKIYIHVYM